MAELIKDSNHKAYSNRIVNQIMTGAGASRENLGLMGDNIIDHRLARPEEYCREANHDNCIHALIEYDHSFHIDDRLRSLDSDSFSIPTPSISYAIWKMLNEKIENRRENEEARFYVRWSDHQKYNVVEINTMNKLGHEMDLLKNDVEKEKRFFASEDDSVPAGIQLLDEKDEDILAVSQQTLFKELYLNQHIPLSAIDRTMNDYKHLDNEQLYNFTSTDRQFFEDEIHLVLEILNNQEDGKDRFLVITPELLDKQKCEEYATNKGVKSAENVHIVVNINLSKGRINVTEQNGHWAYILINEKEIVYGDPLGGRNLPANLIEVLNPIYRAMYGRNIVSKSMKIGNSSYNANFPTQSCSIICGLIAAMICVCSFNSLLFKEIMFGEKNNVKLQFIKTPSAFSKQIRKRFVKIVNSKKHCVEYFVPADIEFYHPSENSDSRSMRKTKSIANKAWVSLMTKKRGKTSSLSNKKASPPSKPTNDPKPSNSDCPPGSTSARPSLFDGLIEPSPKPQTIEDPSVEPQPSPEPSDFPTTQQVKFVKASFIGLKSFNSSLGYPDNDGYLWCSGKKSKGPIKYVCSHDKCTAMKVIFKTKKELKIKCKKGPNNHINVSYITSHSCKENPRIENVLLSSYTLKIKAEYKIKKQEQLSTLEENEVDMNQEDVPTDYDGTREDNSSAMNEEESEQEMQRSKAKQNSEHEEEVIALDIGVTEEDHAHMRNEIEPEQDGAEKQTDNKHDDHNSESTDHENMDNKRAFDQEEEINTDIGVTEDGHGDINNEIYNKNNESPVSSTEQEFAELQLDSNIEPNDPNDNSINDDLHDDGRDNDDEYQEEYVDKPKSPVNKSGTDVEIHSCYICKFVTTVNVDFYVHQQTDHDKICFCCEYITTTECLLNEHREIHGHFVCGLCDFQANSEELKTHYREEHESIQNYGQEGESNNTNSKGINDEGDDQIKEPHECHLCKYVARTQTDFDAHMKLPHGKICICCDYRTTTVSFLYEHKKIHGHFKCDECNFQSNDEDILKSHRTKEHVNLEEEVSVFNSLFRGSSRKRKSTENEIIKKRTRINQTLREASPEDMFDSNVDSEDGQTDLIDSQPTSDISNESYSCFMCDFVTYCLYDYNVHTLTSHTLRCVVCAYKTTTAQLLKEHKTLMSHFRCELCSYSESCEVVLEEHRNNVHSKQVQAKSVGIKKGKKDLSGGIQKRKRINETIEEALPEVSDEADDVRADDGCVPEKDIFGKDNVTDKQKSGDKRMDNDAIKTKHITNYHDSLDDNEGNVAYIVTNYSETKKPKSDRKKTNWGPSQSQRGKTTVYPCAGCYMCESCNEKSTSIGDCSKCKVPRKQITCPARKYVYFCEQTCVRELYRNCCKSEPRKKKLVILYVDEHNCILVDTKPGNKKSYQFKEVQSKDDIMDNLNMYVGNELIDFDIENLEKVPSNIDGNHFYLLDVKENKEIKEIIRDGRKWQTFSQTTSKIFSEILGEINVKKVKKYRCANQFFCYNEQCPFKKRFEIVNQIQFTKEDNGTRTCVSCSEKMEMVMCNAEKYITKSDNNKHILIKHVGKHKCLSKSVLETQILEEMEDYFCLNPTSTRSEAIVHHLIAKISYGTRQEVMDLVAVSLNIWELNNIKAKGIKRLNPHGNKLDAVRLVKSKLEDMGNPFDIIIKVYEDIYVCDSCSYISEKESEDEECVKFCAKCSMTPMEHVGPSVFITSKDSLSTMRELTANRSLETEACCLDHQPSRLREFNTFAGYCYDTDLRRMCPLFAAVMTNERELSVYHCLDVIDRCMKEVFDSNTGFDPNMIIADEATAIKNAVSRKLGIEKVMKQYGTCQLHFMGSVLQHCSFAIGNKKQIWQYMKLSQHLMNAETPEIYDLFRTELLAFVSETEQRHSHLFNWLEFYDQRRTGWSQAYRNAELPKSNKGESGNAHYSAVTHLTKLTLDLGVKAMVAEMHVYSGCRRGITNGQYKGGKGPSRVMMDERMLMETFKRIKNTPLTSKESTAFVKSVLEKIGLNDDNENENIEIPVTKQRSVLATHRYLADQIKARTEARIESPKFINAPHKAPKKSMKRKLKFADTLEDLESDGQQKKIRRKDATKGSSLNEKILKTLTDGFTIKTVEVGVYELTINNDPERCYTVNVNAKPTCTCPEFARIQKARLIDRNTSICKHISVICLCLGFEFSQAIIRRYSYTATQRMLMTLKIAAFCHTNVNIADIKTKFESEMYQKLEPEVQELPFLDTKKYYGQFKTYEEAILFLTMHKERFPCSWFALVYEQARYKCTSGFHTTEDSKKLSRAKPLVFLVHLTRIYFNKTTNRYQARDERKYFHMKAECVSNFRSEDLRLTNIQPPCDIDITRLSTENKAFVKKTFTDYTFVE